MANLHRARERLRSASWVAVVAAFPLALAAGCSHRAGAPNGPGTAAGDAGTGGAFPSVDLGPGRCYGGSPDGHVVGTSNDASGPFVVDPAGQRTTLPLFQGDPSTLPLAIDDAGRIVGVSQHPPAAIVLENGAWSSLAPPAGGQWTAVLDVDAAGDVVGVGTAGGSANAPLAAPLHALFAKAGGATVDLGLPGESAAYRLSGTGLLAGILATDAGATHAFVYRMSPASLTDLGTLGGTNSAAHGINARGDVVGVADTAPGAHHAFVYTNGAMNDLGTLGGGDRSDARGIDDDGTIAGNSATPDGVSHPFFSRGGAMADALPGLGTPSAYAMARVESLAHGTGVGWGIAPDGTSHCLKWTVSP